MGSDALSGLLVRCYFRGGVPHAPSIVRIAITHTHNTQVVHTLRPYPKACVAMPVAKEKTIKWGCLIELKPCLRLRTSVLVVGILSLMLCRDHCVVAEEGWPDNGLLLCNM